MRNPWTAAILLCALAGCSHRASGPSDPPARARITEAERLYRSGLAHARADDLEAARSAWRRGAELDPYHAGLCAELGMLELAQGDATTAIALLERAARLRPVAANLRNLAHALVANGYMARAAGAFAELFQIDEPTLDDALRMIDLGLAEPDPLADALAWAKRAVQIDPDAHEAHVALGRVLAARGAPRAEVDAAFERAQELAPRDAIVEIPWASALEGIGEGDAAVERITDAIVRLPDVPSLHAQHVAMLAKHGRCQEARMELDRVRARFPREAAPLQWRIDRCRSRLDPTHRELDPQEIDDKQISGTQPRLGRRSGVPTRSG